MPSSFKILVVSTLVIVIFILISFFVFMGFFLRTMDGAFAGDTVAEKSLEFDLVGFESAKKVLNR